MIVGRLGARNILCSRSYTIDGICYVAGAVNCAVVWETFYLFTVVFIFFVSAYCTGCGSVASGFCTSAGLL